MTSTLVRLLAVALLLNAACSTPRSTDAPSAAAAAAWPRPAAAKSQATVAYPADRVFAATVRFVRGDGLIIDSRPETRRAGINGSILLWRSTSLLVSAERTTGNDYQELRMLAGITVRMR